MDLPPAASGLHVDVGAHAVTMLLDRPATRNALDLDTSRALAAALERHETTPLPVATPFLLPV